MLLITSLTTEGDGWKKKVTEPFVVTFFSHGHTEAFAVVRRQSHITHMYVCYYLCTLVAFSWDLCLLVNATSPQLHVMQEW